MLRREGLVTEALAEKMLAWRHTGFSAHNSVRVHARDAAGRRKLAQYMLRAPFALEKMSYDSASGMVLYRSRMHKTFKRNFEIMPGAEWFARLCSHIPDRFEHLVRYAGWYSNRARGKRRRAGAEAQVSLREPDVPETARVRSTWARLIHKVYEVDPLECPRCHGPMRMISLIEDAVVIRKVLTHLSACGTPKMHSKGDAPRPPPIHPRSPSPSSPTTPSPISPEPGSRGRHSPVGKPKVARQASGA